MPPPTTPEEGPSRLRSTLAGALRSPLAWSLAALLLVTLGLLPAAGGLVLALLAVGLLRAGPLARAAGRPGAPGTPAPGDGVPIGSETATRDRFTSFVSHELRRPLHAMQAWLPMLSEDRDPSRRSRAIGVFEQNLALMGRLVEDLVDAARIRSGREELRLERRRCDLAGVVDLVARSEAATAEERDVVLRSPPPGSGPVPVDGDFERLQQAISNLVSNAIKFSEPGGRVEIRLECEGDQAQVVVEDEGRGIAPEELPRVFELYAQVGPPSPEAPAGLGLGLPITAMIARQHGGHVRAESEGPGRGARFELSLPVARGGLVTRSDAAEPAPVVLEGMRVLVADPNRAAAEALALVLEEAGAGVEWVRDGLSAQAFARTMRPDLFVCGLDTDEALRTLERIQAAPGKAPRSVALVAARSGDLGARLRRLGFDATARRSLSPAEIAGTIIRLLGLQPRVLLVDDDRDSADSLAILLERRGFDVEVAYGFEEAIGKASALDLPLVVTDLDLRDGTGQELARRCREMGARRIVAVSGQAPAEVEQGAECFDAYVRKPVDPAALVERLSVEAAAG